MHIVSGFMIWSTKIIYFCKIYSSKCDPSKHDRQEACGGAHQLLSDVEIRGQLVLPPFKTELRSAG